MVDATDSAGNEDPRRSTGRAYLHVGGNGLGNLEMPGSLDFSHLQQIGWK
jgi:hypothetical protein